jgi:hypothetical protein
MALTAPASIHRHDVAKIKQSGAGTASLKILKLKL